MIHFRNKFNAAFLATILCLGTGASHAASVSYDMNGVVDFGPLSGETYAGQFTFDDATLTGAGEEFLQVGTLNFSFLGNAFNQRQGDAPPEAIFLDGAFLGLGFNVSTFDPGFAIIAGIDNVSESYFAYDNGAGSAGFGSLVYTVSAIPEPEILTMLLAGMALVGYVVRRRRKF